MNTTYFMNQVMGNVFNTKKSPALPTEYYIGLSSTAPGLDGTGVTEPALSAGYARVKLDVLSEPTAGVITNEQAISYDALDGGNLLMYDTLSTARNVEAATIVTIKAGSLTLTLSNNA